MLAVSITVSAIVIEGQAGSAGKQGADVGVDVDVSAEDADTACILLRASCGL